MVETVHTGGGNGAVRQHAVPALPDRRRTKIYLIKPTRVFLIEKEIIGHIVFPDAAKLLAEDRGSNEAGLQPAAILCKEFGEPVRNPVRIRGKAKPEREQHRRLRIDAAPAVQTVILLPDILQSFCGESLILPGFRSIIQCFSPCSICAFRMIFGVHSSPSGRGGHSVRCSLFVLLPPRQHFCRIRSNPHRIKFVDLRDESLIRPAEDRVHAAVSVEREPVAIVKMPAPTPVILIKLFDVVHPGLHGFIVLHQNLRIAAVKIHVPGDDRRRIPPRARCRIHIERGNNVRDTAVSLLLLGCHIIKIFHIKRVSITLVQRGRRENFRVAGPAHALVALRAVRRFWMRRFTFASPVSIVPVWSMSE